MRIWQHILWIAILSSPLFLAAQDCTITVRGKVLDEHDGSPLEYTSVYVVETGRGTMADAEGQFLLEGLCPGAYTLMASHVGCEPERIKVFLLRDTVIDLYLEHHIEMLELVTARAFRIGEASSQTRSELSGQELQRLQGRSLAQMLNGISGVSMVQTGPGIQKPLIHGLYGNRILIVQHDVRQEGQQWGVDHAPEIDPTVAGKISVIKGAEGVRYGPEALGGVILITPDPLPRSPGISGSVLTEGQTNGRGGKLAATLQGGLSRAGWGWRSTASFRRLGDMAAARYLLANTGLVEAGWSGQVGFTGNRHTIDVYYSYYQGQFGILRAAHIGNLSDLETAITAPEPWYQRPFSYDFINPRQEVAHHLIKAEASRQISHIWTMRSRYSFQRDDRQEFDIRRGDRDNTPALDLRILTGQAEVLAEHRPWRHWKGQIGAGFQHQSNFNLPGTGTRPLIPNYINGTGSLFAIERYIRDHYELEGGVRYDYRYLEVSRFNASGVLEEPTYTFTNLNFTIGGLYRFHPSWSILLNGGTAFRPPGVHELYSQGLHHSSAAIEEGNAGLRPEKGWKSVTTLRYQGSRLQGELTGFLHHINGYIYLRPEAEYALTIRGAFPVFRYVQSDVRLMGLDGSIGLDLGKGWHYQGQASLLWAQDLKETEPLWGMPPFHFRQELRYSLSGREGTWQLGFAGNLRHVMRQHRFPDRDFSPPPGAYTLIGAHAELEWGRKRLMLGVDNLWNVAYRDYLDRLRYFADGTGRNVYLKAFISF